MTKNLKLAFILFSVFFGIIMAWNTLTNFFSGVGLNYVAILVVLALILMLTLTDKFVASRTKELFISVIVFAVLEFLIYFIFEFQIGSFKVWEVFQNFQKVFSFFALLVFAYIAFRVICEVKGIKFGFIETMLGNEKKGTKQKKAKELSNGSLEDKPNHTQPDPTEEHETVEENIVINNEEE